MAVLAAASAAGPQQLPVFGASAELVVIDLVATDDDGRFVPDLRAEEIEVLEDGRPRQVEFLRLVGTGPAAAAGPRAVEPGAGATPAAAAGAIPGAAPVTSLVVVVDLATMPFEVLARTREAVVTMVRGALDQARVDSTGMLRGLVDEANRAQVSVYTVDARGLTGDVLPARARAPGRMVESGAAQAVMRRRVRAPQEILSSIADGTGATASLNTNELARGLHAAAADARGYYLLAYAPPPGRTQGRFYPVEVKLPEARYADLRSRDNVEIAADAPAPKAGRYEIAVALRHSGGRLAAASVRFEVP